MPVKFGSIIHLNNSASEATMDANNLRGNVFLIDDFNSASLATIGAGVPLAPGKRRLGTIVATTGSENKGVKYYTYIQTSSGDSNLSGSEWTTLTNWSELTNENNFNTISSNNLSWHIDLDNNRVTSSLDVFTKGDITASGDISTSGDVIGNTGIFNSISGFISNDSANRVLTTDGDGTLTAESSLQINGGALTGDFYSFSARSAGGFNFTDSFFNVEGNITASGNISSSGYITASNIMVVGGVLSIPGYDDVEDELDDINNSITTLIAGGADNLGTHTASLHLNMDGNNIYSASVFSFDIKSTTPAAVAGGMFYSGSNDFYLGFA
jgi:hypothetical protein